VGFTVVITILTPVNVTWNERLPELRSLNILGMSVGVMRVIGMLEALILGLGIGLLSSLLSFAIIQIFFRIGIDISFMNGGQIVERAGIELPSIIFPIATMENLSLSFLFPLPIIFISYLLAMNLPIKKLSEGLE
jgi:ABC-type antimicrobial peptide transport system permease subunit